MKIYQLLHALMEKFVPMDEASKMDLASSASSEYGKLLQKKIDYENEIKEVNAFNQENEKKIIEGKIEAKNLPKKNPQIFIITLLEQWWMRYLIAISFIFLVPKIKAIINGETSKREDEDEDEDDDLTEFMKYRRFKKSML